MNDRILPRLALGLALLAPMASGAAIYSKDFDDVGGGVAALLGEGWILRDQSSAVGQGWWSSQWAVTSGFFPQISQAGAGHLAFESSSNLQATTNVSAWAILPPIPGMAAGDVLEFWQAGGAVGPNVVIEVRFSPTGGTNTGSGPTALGDFSTLLAAYSLVDGGPYIQSQLVMPGAGRLAFRVKGTALPMFANSPHYRLDSLRFNPPPPPFPIPNSGQTVHWTLGMSPITIDSNVAIPVGGTVIIDAGVEVRIAAGKRIDILGTIDANGAAGANVTFVKLGAIGGIIPYAGGTLSLRHAHVDVPIEPRNGARILGEDTVFAALGSIKNAALAFLEPERSVVRFERCVFQGSTLQIDNVMAALRDVDFLGQTNSSDVMLFGYVRLEDVTIDGTCIRLGKEHGIQPVYLDGVTVRNSASRGGFYLQGGTDFLLGPNNVLQNDLWPVEFGSGCAGLLPGSVVPTTGNQNDFVVDTSDFNPQATVTWGALDVPYVVRAVRYLGHQRILPGARIEFMPGTSWRAQEWGTLDAVGTREQPIVFDRHVAGQSWYGIEMFNSIQAQKLEHCVFRGADRAVGSKNVQVDSCVFENCAEALYSVDGSWTVARSSRFTGNSIAINGNNPLTFTDGAIRIGTTTNPNSFSGNAIAVRSSNGPLPNSGSGNWWGHPSGPFHPSLNPQGQGDKIEAFAAFPFQPFLTAPPQTTDAPPQVSFTDGRVLTVEPGRTLFLSWTAQDDGAIFSQRLYFSSNGNTPGSMLPVNATLLPGQRTVAFTVPSFGYQVNAVSAFLRIEATDSVGQIGYDELELFITDESLAGSVSLTTPLAGQTYRPGDHVAVGYTTSGVSPIIAPAVNGMLVFDNDRESIPLGGATYTYGTLPLGLTMPEVSSDRVRLALVLTHSINQVKYFFSEPFAIRPAPELGDAAPSITLTSPLEGDTFIAGEVVPIRFTAADDEALRSFDIAVSTDGGRRFTAVVRDLPSTTREYDWRLPPATAMAGAEIVVVAHDRRFQNSSDQVRIDVASDTNCQQNLGYGKSGGPSLSLCGAPLASGQSGVLTLVGGPGSQPGVLALSTTLAPQPFLGGTLAAYPLLVWIPIATNPAGQFAIPAVPGGFGPLTLVMQAIVAAPSDPFGATLSNALRVDLLP